MKRFFKTLSRTDLLLCALLVATAVLCHGRYLLTPDLLFATEGDSFRQILPNTVLYQRMLQGGDLFWSWSFGLGGDVFTELSYAGTTSPFTYLQFALRALFGCINSDLLEALRWKLGFSVFRQALSMILLYALLRGERKKPVYALIGALTYGCAPWFLYRAIVFDFMTDVYPLLPLVALAYDRYQKTGKWVFLSVCVALLVGTNLYFGYISCVFFATAFLILLLEKGNNGRAYWGRVLKIAGICGAGAAMAAVSLLPSANAILSSDRTVANAPLVLLPHLDTLKGLFEQLFVGSGKFGLPLLILLLPFLKRDALPAGEKKRTALALLWLLLLLIPAAASMMNGFSYETPRWHFVVVFAVAWALPGWLAALEEGCRIRPWMLWTLCGLLCAGLYALYALSDDLILSSLSGAAWVLSFGLSLCGLLLTGFGPRLRKGRFGRYWAAALALTVLFSGVLNSVSVRVKDLHASELINSFYCGASVKAANEDLAKGDGTFYRVHDRTTDTFGEDGENRPYVYGTYGVSNYASELSGHLTRWHRKIFRFPSTPICANIYQSFDDRLFHDVAWGVRYKIDPTQRAATLSDNWQPAKTASGQDVYESRLFTGLDLWYDTAVPEETWLELPLAQRDATLLQTAAIAEEEYAFHYPEPVLDQVTESLELTFDDAVVSGGTWIGDGRLLVADRAILTFGLPKMDRAGEWLLACSISEVSDQAAFYISVGGRTLDKFSDSLASESLNYPYTDYSFRISGEQTAVSITLTAGEYTLSDLHVSFNSYEKLEEWVAARNRYKLEDLRVDGSHLSGVINNDTLGILVLAMPCSYGWSCRVDGVKTPLFMVNGIMIGMELAAGSHRVEMQYHPPYLALGLCITLCVGFAVFAATVIQRKKKGKLP